MNPRSAGLRCRHVAGSRATRTASACVAVLTAVLALSACQPGVGSPALEFPEAPVGELGIDYPLDETLFPPDIAAPAVVWSDETEGVSRWRVLLRFGDEGEALGFAAVDTQWRPAEEDWSEIKRRSREADAELAVVGMDAQGTVLSAASLRIRTSSHPVGDSIFYREVPLPFIEAVQDPSRIRWRFGSVGSVEQPPVVLEDLPVCGNCHSFSGDGGVLGLDVDYGNDKGG